MVEKIELEHFIVKGKVYLQIRIYYTDGRQQSTLASFDDQDTVLRILFEEKGKDDDASGQN